MRKYLKLSILVDNPDSWFNEHLGKLFKIIRKYDPRYSFVRNVSELSQGDILFILSCDRLLTKKYLSLHKSNIVIHASDLPKGRGWSPWTWQVEQGKNIILLTLFEASEEGDAGDYYLKDCIILDGTELIGEIRKKVGNEVINMVARYLACYPMKSIPQKGKATYYRKRIPEDNTLDINKSIKSQFNKMRVADNERYPLHFTMRGEKYILKVYKGKPC